MLHNKKTHQAQPIDESLTNYLNQLLNLEIIWQHFLPDLFTTNLLNSLLGTTMLIRLLWSLFFDQSDR